MRTTPILGLLALCSLALPVPSRGAEPAAAWRPLFDGKSLDGWEHLGPGGMRLENGMLRTEGGMGLLWYTREKFGDSSLNTTRAYARPKPFRS